MVFDVGRIEVERQLLAPLEHVVDAREGLLERTVELPDVPQREATQETTERGRVGKTVTAEELLGGVGAQERHVVEALAAHDERLAQGEDRLRRRVPALPLLDRDLLE